MKIQERKKKIRVYLIQTIVGLSTRIRHMPPDPETRKDSKRWKRKYMETEHMRRKYVDRWETDIKDFSATIYECENTIATLRAELKHAHTMHSTHRQVIQHLQTTLDLHGIPNKHTMMSISNCRAADGEICPLSRAPINKSPLPYSDGESPSTLVLNAAKPEHKCAELACGHRFNSLWLIHHFIERSTFRCPVCSAGQLNFRFQKRDLPPGVIQLLKSVSEAAKTRKMV